MRVLAMNVEAQLIHVPTGCQDHYPALYGGVSAIELSADGSHRHSLPIAPEEIEARFLLAYTGAPRQSGINNWEVFKAHMDGNKRVRRNFQQIAQIAASIRITGFVGSILADPEGTIIAGHGRFEAAKLLNLPEVPVTYLRHLNPALDLPDRGEILIQLASIAGANARLQTTRVVVDEIENAFLKQLSTRCRDL